MKRLDTESWLYEKHDGWWFCIPKVLEGKGDEVRCEPETVDLIEAVIRYRAEELRPDPGVAERDKLRARVVEVEQALAECNAVDVPQELVDLRAKVAELERERDEWRDQAGNAEEQRAYAHTDAARLREQRDRLVEAARTVLPWLEVARTEDESLLVPVIEIEDALAAVESGAGIYTSRPPRRPPR
jgi:chromosome segregation ATPase